MNLSNRVRFIIAPTPRAPLIRRNEHGRQQQLVGNLSAGISRWNCINLSSRNGALSFFRYRAGSISRGGPRCFHASLHYFHIISHPEKLQKESHMAEYHQRDRERETRGAANGNGCYFHATFDFPLRVTGISLFIFRLLNYIPINKLPAHLGSLIYHSIDFTERTTPSS